MACFDNLGNELLFDNVRFVSAESDARIEDIKLDTTKAAEEERPEPVGTVPSIRI
jgi:hypothetical protein